MKYSPAHLLLLSSALFSMVSCGPLHDFKEMHDSTAQMAGTTSEMNKTTLKMAETTQAMAQNMVEMLNQTKDMSAKMVEMAKGMKDMIASMAVMSTQMNALPEMNANMKTMSGKMDALPEMNTNMKTMSGKMDVLAEMNKNMTDLRGDIAKMTVKMELLTAMNENMKSMSLKMDVLKQMNDSMGLLRGDIAEVTQRMNLLTTMNQSMTQLLGKMGSMSEKMDLLKDMNLSMTALRTQITSLTSKLDVLAEMNDNMKDIHKDMTGITKQMFGMNENIVQMTSQMTGLSGDIKTMKNILTLTHSDLRLIFTGQHRLETLKAMESANDQSTKMGFAAEYMIAQTFQSWNSQSDTPEARTELMGLATPAFFLNVLNYVHDRNEVYPTKDDSQSKNLYSIAAALDYINSIQMDGLKGTDLKPVTMLSMIEDGLKAGVEVRAGRVKLSDLPVYSREVYNHEQDAIYLLRVRQNFLKGVAYTLMTLDEDGDPQSFKKSVWEVIKARGLRKSWNAHLDKKDNAQIELIATVLDAACETEKFLRDLGVKPMNYSNLEALWKKLKVTKADSTEAQPEIEHFSKAIAQLIALDNLPN